MTSPALQPLALEKVIRFNLQPLARLARSASSLADAHGFHFTRGVDEHGNYEIVALRLKFAPATLQKSVVFALRAAAGLPGGTVDIWLPSKRLDSPDLPETLAKIASALAVPADAITLFPPSERASEPAGEIVRAVAMKRLQAALGEARKYDEFIRLYHDMNRTKPEGLLF